MPDYFTYREMDDAMGLTEMSVEDLVDKALMQELPGRSGTASAFRFSVQSWELPQKACSSPKHQALVAFDITGEADKNRCEDSP